LYTYCGARLYANDSGGAIYIGVRIKEKDVEGWFADNLSTVQLLDSAEVKTGHVADWAVRRGGYRKCEGGRTSSFGCARTKQMNGSWPVSLSHCDWVY
jgi:hypothetical protein